jgi:serine/threonine-protein kinase
MGLVWMARHVHLAQRVAVKVLREEIAANPKSVARFVREARTVALLRSDNIVRVTDVDMPVGEAPYMVMELLEGDDLANVLHARGRLTVGQAAWIVAEACGAMIEAHKHGIVHRDLKPSNLFLARRSSSTAGPEAATVQLKVLDFGISKAILASDTPNADLDLTASDRLIGSPRYMSPEQVRGNRQVDARTDIWALGAILYELVGGIAPFDGASIGDTLARVASEPPVSLRHVVPGVPAEVAAIVERCLEKNPDARFGTARELLAAIKPFATEPMTLGSAPADVSTGSERPRTLPYATTQASPELSTKSAASLSSQREASLPPPARRRRWPWAVAIAIAALGTLGLRLSGLRVTDGTREPTRAAAIEPVAAPPRGEPVAPPPAIPAPTPAPQVSALPVVSATASASASASANAAPPAIPSARRAERPGKRPDAAPSADDALELGARR